MRLADFILQNIEPILEQWEAFAASLLPAARNLDSHALRDDAQQLLEAVAKDLSTSQSREEQREKSLGAPPSRSTRQRRPRRPMRFCGPEAASISTNWHPSIEHFVPASCVCG